MDILLYNPSLSPQSTTKHNHQLTPRLNHPPPPAPQMTSEPGDRRLSKIVSGHPEMEQLTCPRCNSTNTKFCYYNNYNLSQPRHFCKSCRRYWTRGGALRDVPVGGGTRKPPAFPSSSKRRRTVATTSASSSTDDDVSGQIRTETTNPLISVPVTSPVVNLNETASGASWWSSTGLLHLNGHELGPGLNYGPGFWDWPMEPVGEWNDGDRMVSRDNTWQMFGDADDTGDYFFSWPEVAVSTPPSKALK